MKRIILSLAALSLSAGIASAMTSSSDLSGSEEHEVRRFVPNAELDNLTSAQVHAIRAVLYGDNDHRAGTIRSILLN
jgi:hypothetical protein